MHRVVAGFFAFLLNMGACRPADPAPSEPLLPALALVDEPRPAAVLSRRRGGVELRRGGGEWSAAKLGDGVEENDGLRTRGDGDAEVSVEGIRVRLRDRGELHASKIGAGSLRARVRGRVDCEVEAGKGRLALHVDGSDAEATSEGGRFHLTADGRGAVTVETIDGAVTLSGRGRSVEVRKGETSRLAPDEVPEQPAQAVRTPPHLVGPGGGRGGAGAAEGTPPPGGGDAERQRGAARGERAQAQKGRAPDGPPDQEKVQLAVDWPEQRTSRASVPVSGRVAAGSRVFVQGNAVEVSPSGEFRVDVKLHEGRQRIAVLAIDPSGRKKEESREVVQAGSLPDVRMTNVPWRR